MLSFSSSLKKRKSSSRSSNHKKRKMSSRRPRPQSKNEIITPKLFHLTQQHHKKCLRQLFLQHYEPSGIDGKFQKNPQWTVGLRKSVMNDLRLHLTWVLKGEVFHWTDEQTGKKILKIFSTFDKTSSSTFVKHTDTCTHTT